MLKDNFVTYSYPILKPSYNEMNKNEIFHVGVEDFTSKLMQCLISKNKMLLVLLPKFKILYFYLGLKINYMHKRKRQSL